jgi:hypothetical protein
VFLTCPDPGLHGPSRPVTAVGWVTVVGFLLMMMMLGAVACLACLEHDWTSAVLAGLSAAAVCGGVAVEINGHPLAGSGFALTATLFGVAAVLTTRRRRRNTFAAAVRHDIADLPDDPGPRR